jgi:hypothetical protein
VKNHPPPAPLPEAGKGEIEPPSKSSCLASRADSVLSTQYSVLGLLAEAERAIIASCSPPRFGEGPGEGLRLYVANTAELYWRRDPP